MENTFNHIAGSYDKGFSHTLIGEMLRRRVWTLLHPHTGNSVKVLEINCGTGEDAVWLARQGCMVLATDGAPNMVERTQDKILQHGLQSMASAVCCPFEHLNALPERDFDLVFSNFGGLNCIGPEALHQLGIRLAARLKPGGRLIAVVMGKNCLWEWLYFTCKRNFSEVFRRKKAAPLRVKLHEGIYVNTWYYQPNELAKALNWNMIRLEPVGFWIPPPYLNAFFRRRRLPLRVLNFLERNASLPGFARFSDHFYAELIAPDELYTSLK